MSEQIRTPTLRRIRVENAPVKPLRRASPSEHLDTPTLCNGEGHYVTLMTLPPFGKTCVSLVQFVLFYSYDLKHLIQFQPKNKRCSDETLEKSVFISSATRRVASSVTDRAADVSQDRKQQNQDSSTEL